MNIPEVISNFNVYGGDNSKLIGVSGEVTLPDLSAVTATVSGAGLLGDMDVPVPGQIGSIEQAIPFNVLTVNVFKQFKLNKIATVMLRGDIQTIDSATGAYKHVALKTTFKGYVKSISPGKVKAADTMGASVTLELTYVHIEIDGQTVIKIDKLNEVFIVDGEDLLADIRKNC